MDIIIGSKNRGKINEIESILNLPSVKWHTFDKFSNWPDLPESADSYCENAVSKAKTLTLMFGMAAMADDSGLEVDALGGEPGPLSARFAGPRAGDRQNVARLLELMAGVPEGKRSARFRCWLALTDPGGVTLTTEGVCEGTITKTPRGSLGFGYDPVFVPDGYEQTFAEMFPEQKNSISHRALALQRMREEIRRHYGF